MIGTLQTHVLKGKEYFDMGCEKIAEFLDQNPLLYKITLIACHIFRALTMGAFMAYSLLGSLATCSLTLFSSVLYRAGVERFCAFRFMMPSVLGAAAFWAAKAAAVSFVAGAAFSTLGTTLGFGLGVASLAGYLTFVCFISHSDVENHLQKLNLAPQCCRG